jgi:RimJ/RimL family protein N-acetyltransferase
MQITDNLFSGKLVRLAAPKPEDHETMAKWTNDSEFARMSMNDPAMPRNAEAMADDDKKDKERQNQFAFRIRTLEDDRLIGFLDLFVQWGNQIAWLGIGIGEPEYWGRGYGSDATQLGVNYAFRELGLYKVTLGVFAYNTRAVKSYEKVGFVHEGSSRAMLYRDGQHHDMIYMGILRPEWEARLNAQGSSAS